MTAYEIEVIENEIISRLDNKETVYIESGAANDVITSYSVQEFQNQYQEYDGREVSFFTTACIFPKKIVLSYYENIELEEFRGELFVQVY